MRELVVSNKYPTSTDNAFRYSPTNVQKARMRVLPPLALNPTFGYLQLLDMERCPLITDATIEAIISHAPNIQYLFLSECKQLTDRTVEAISKLKSLLRLNLGYIDNITDGSIRLVATSCTRLQHIDITECTFLTNMSVCVLSTLPELCRVHLAGIYHLTDKAIYALAENTPTLEEIYLSGCDQITLMAIHSLLLNCGKLIHLCAHWIPAFCNSEFQAAYLAEGSASKQALSGLTGRFSGGDKISHLRDCLAKLYGESLPSSKEDR